MRGDVVDIGFVRGFKILPNKNFDPLPEEEYSCSSLHETAERGGSHEETAAGPYWLIGC
jgi:hypothetical protein